LPGSLPDPFRTLVRLAVPCRVDAVEPTRQSLLRALDDGQIRLSERTLYRLELVLEEVLMNIARHGFGGKPNHHAMVELGLSDTAVRLQFEDEGQPFDPTQPLREPVAQLADTPEGGRGLRLLQRTANALDYQRVDGRNLLRVTIAR